LLLATAHASHMEDLWKRPLYHKLMKSGVFRRAVILRPDKSYTMEEVEQ